MERHPGAILPTRAIRPENPQDSYFLGIVTTDGHMSRSETRGKLSVELGVADRLILDHLAHWLGNGAVVRTRTRTTNFSKNYTSAELVVTRTGLIDQLIDFGVPPGKKSGSVSVPSVPFSESDFWRGVIDGDGSLGITATDQPFISLVTQSELLAVAYKEYVLAVTKKELKTNRNRRDGVYNLSIFNEGAQELARHLYYSGCFGIARKIAKAQDVLNWNRPDGRKIASPRQDWDYCQDEFLYRYGPARAMESMGRTLNSVTVRLKRIRSAFEMLEMDDG
jgi:hypothetical protein